MVLITVLACATFGIIVTMISLVATGCCRKHKKHLAKPEVIYDEPDCVWSIKMDDNAAYGHVHSCK